MATGRIVDLWHRKDRTRTTRYGTGKRWQAVWTDNTGKETKRSFDYKDQAQAWIDTRTIDDALTPGGTKQPILFEDYFELWWEKQAHQRPNSLRTMGSHCKNWIEPTFKGQYLHQIEQAQVQRAVYEWQEKNALSTTKLMYRYTSQIFGEAVHDKYLKESPCKRIKFMQEELAENLPEFTLSPEVFAQFCDLAKPLFKTAALIAAATGLRPKELIGLTVKDIDFPRSIIKLTMQDASPNVSTVRRGPLKTKYSRRNISFGPMVRGLLKALCANPGDDGRLFHIERTPALYWRFESEWSRVRDLLPEIGPGWHQLRHFHASQLISGGMSPVAVAARLGHKDATITLQKYAHLWHEDAGSMAKIGDSVVALGRSTATETPQVA
ncbi:tyrosine-type recombinase/integrase [Glutamicibacter sp.]|uniref:tyrosine-type recombinase/integrase n=1 Tax=Glutamicibacter sp. TaxID=1931995 RepID=UPI003D6C5940